MPEQKRHNYLVISRLWTKIAIKYLIGLHLLLFKYLEKNSNYRPLGVASFAFAPLLLRTQMVTPKLKIWASEYYNSTPTGTGKPI